MSSEAIVGTVVGVTVGLVAATIGAKAVQDFIEKVHQLELDEVKAASFQDGWREASNNPTNIRKRFEEMFSAKNGGTGTTLKTPKPV